MNEKIKKIAEDAGLAWCMQTDWDQQNIQDFAISIINQCITIAEYPQLDDEQAYYGKLFAEYIRNHFNLG